MNWFTDFFTGKTFKPVVTPPPAPVDLPPLSEVPDAPTTVSGTRIKIEHYNKNLRRWNEQPVPFRDLGESTRFNTTVFKVRVTVLEGVLTVTSSTASGKHNPSITKYNSRKVWKSGEQILFDCALGARTGGTRGHQDDIYFGVDTKELGKIIDLTTRVIYLS